MERNNHIPSSGSENLRSAERPLSLDPFTESLSHLRDQAATRFRGRQDGEDIAQDTALALWEQRVRLEAMSTPELSRYATRTATNKMRDANRRELRRTPLAGAGRYPDPDSGAHLRYWDGTRWTDRIYAGHRELVHEPSERSSRLLPRCAASSTQQLDETAGDSWQPSQDNPTEDDVLANELFEQVNQLIAQLPVRQAQAIRMQISGLSHHEMADLLGITPGAANSLRLHGRTQLRSQLQEKGLM